MMTIEINSDLMKRYYSILGIDSESSLDEIKLAYRRLAKTVHPDIGGDPVRFRDIQDAYKTLSDPRLREKYDDELASLPFDGEPYKTVEAAVITEPVDVFDDVVDVVSRRIGMEKKTKIKAVIPISANDALIGVNIEVIVPMEIICQRCFGFGGTLISSCKECAGKGTIGVLKKGYMAVKPGVVDGDTIVVRSGKTEIIGIIEIEK